MRTPSCLTVFLSMTLAATAAAQTNLVQNGDLEASATSIAPWSITGFAENPLVESFDTTGCGKSNAYAATIVSSTPHTLQQPVQLKKGERYVYKVALHITKVSSGWTYTYARAGYRVGTKWTDLPRFTIVPYTATNYVRYIGGAFTPTEDADAFRISLYHGGGNYKYRIRVDEVVLATDALPILFVPESRSLAPWTSPVTQTMSTAGTPGIANVIFLSTKRLATGVPIPTFQGKLFLDPSLLLLIDVIVNDQQGIGSKVHSYPKALATSLIGLPLHYQPIAVNFLQNIKSLGWPACLAFVK